MDELERIVRAYNEACSGDDVAAIGAFFVDGAVIYDLNHPPVVGREAIGAFWSKVRGRWGGARWTTDRVVTDGRLAVAEWTMHGRRGDTAFAFRGADVFAFAGSRERDRADGRDGPPLIAEIRQYWRFDPASLGSGLVGYPYPEPGPL